MDANTVDERKGVDDRKVKEMRRLLSEENGARKVEQRFGAEAKGSKEFREAQRQRQQAQRVRERARERAQAEAKHAELRRSKARTASDQGKAAQQHQRTSPEAPKGPQKAAGKPAAKQLATGQREKLIAERTRAREDEKSRESLSR